jgi:hypothetical protein
VLCWLHHGAGLFMSRQAVCIPAAAKHDNFGYFQSSVTVL